ncbi:MAG: SRPBCC domain-containing protein, partial [Asticcacaulis sp.]
PDKSLSYSWSAMGVETIVTWTLTPTQTGTHLRMEQSGFKAEPQFAQYYQGAQYGWQVFFGKLENTLQGAD